MSDRILTADGARYWLAMDGWAHDEAAWLLQGFDPHRLTAQSVRVGGRMVLLPPPEPDPQDPFVAMLSRAGEAAALRFPAAPADVIEWAMKKGLRLPAPLIPDGATLRAGPALPAAATAEAPLEPPDPQRRLDALRALGGTARFFKGEWKFTGIAKLAAMEKEKSRRRCDEKTIRADLKEAAEAEKQEGKSAVQLLPWNHP